MGFLNEISSSLNGTQHTNGPTCTGYCTLAQGRCTHTPPLSWGQTGLQVGGVCLLSKSPMAKGPPLS